MQYCQRKLRENEDYWLDVECDESLMSKLYSFDWKLFCDQVKQIKEAREKFQSDEKVADNNDKEFELVTSIKQVQKQLRLQQQYVTVKLKFTHKTIDIVISD